MRIGELARTTGVSIDTLRYYERVLRIRDAGGMSHEEHLEQMQKDAACRL